MIHTKGRIAMIQPEQATGEVGILFEGATNMLGRVAASIRTLGNTPHVGSLLLPFLATLQREATGSLLASRIKELVIIKTSQLNGCDY